MPTPASAPTLRPEAPWAGAAPAPLIDLTTLWPDRPAGVQAALTTRAGGVSGAPWDQWNLGDHVGDHPAHVADNRRLLAQRLGARPVYLRQVHGTQVVALTADTPDGSQADACWTSQPGVACTVMVADCLPVLLCSADGQSVAAAHAGWRGLAGADGLGVLEALSREWPAASEPAARAGIRVWLGPCIGPQAFEVGPEVRAAFVAPDPAAEQAFVPTPQHAQDGKWLCHLPLLARQRLQALGYTHIDGNDGSPAWCTVTQASVFFSHRRDSRRFGNSGRFAACIWRRV